MRLLHRRPYYYVATYGELHRKPHYGLHTVRPSVRLSVCPMPKIYSNKKAIETSNLVKIVFTARCTLVQSAVLRSHVVCLSVCPSVRL